MTKKEYTGIKRGMKARLTPKKIRAKRKAQRRAAREAAVVPLVKPDAARPHALGCMRDGPNDGWSAEYEVGRQDALAGGNADPRRRVAGMYPLDYQTGYEAGCEESATEDAETDAKRTRA
jgi:hypothetical protein